MTDSEKTYVSSLEEQNKSLNAENFQLRTNNEQLNAENIRLRQHEKEYMANSQESYSAAVEMKNRLKRVLKFVIDEM